MQTCTIVYLTAEGVVSLLIMTGNGLTLYAIYQNEILHTSTNVFIASLAAADFFVGLVVVPVALLPELGLPKEFYSCLLLNSVVVIFTNISTLAMVAIAVDRYLAISNPFNHKRILSKRTAKISVLGIWMIGSLLGLVPLMGWHADKQKFNNCWFGGVIDMSFLVYLELFGFVMPAFIFFAFVYSYIYHVARKQKCKVDTQRLSVLTLTDVKRQRKKRTMEIIGAKWLSLVVLAFAVCWSPLRIFDCVRFFHPGAWNEIGFPANLHLLYTLIVLSHVNSACNPILYAFSNRRMKFAMLRTIDNLCGSRFSNRFGLELQEELGLISQDPCSGRSVDNRSPLSRSHRSSSCPNVSSSFSHPLYMVKPNMLDSSQSLVPSKAAFDAVTVLISKQHNYAPDSSTSMYKSMKRRDSAYKLRVNFLDPTSGMQNSAGDHEPIGSRSL